MAESEEAQQERLRRRNERDRTTTLLPTENITINGTSDQLTKMDFILAMKHPYAGV